MNINDAAKKSGWGALDQARDSEFQTECPRCHGSGKVASGGGINGGTTCPRCNGSGWVKG